MWAKWMYFKRFNRQNSGVKTKYIKDSLSENFSVEKKKEKNLFDQNRKHI